MSKNNHIVNVRMLKRYIITVILFVIVAPISLDLIFPMVSAKVVVNHEEQFQREPKAPMVISDDNVYIAWWTNKTAANNTNQEVMFKASNDGGQTFGDKINLSNTTDSDSWKVEIAGDGGNVVVSWWETNQTDDIPVARVSTDFGETFGPTLMLTSNGTIGSEAGEATAAQEEE